MLNPQTEYFMLEEMEAEKQVGLIIIPDSAQNKLNQGRLVSCGPDCIEPPTIGTICVFPFHSDYKVTYKKKTYILVKQSDLLATITKDEEK